MIIGVIKEVHSPNISIHNSPVIIADIGAVFKK